MRLKRLFIRFAVLPVMLCAVACDWVYDDLSNCPGNKLVFSYTADDDREHLIDYVEDLQVFVFSLGDGALVERRHVSREHLSEGLEVHLPDGFYKVVAVGNALKETSISQDESYASLFVSRPEQGRRRQTEAVASASFDRLYSGVCDIEARPLNRRPDTLQLYSRHVKVHATVLPDMSGDENRWFELQREQGFRLTMGPLPARFAFDGQSAGSMAFELPFVADEQNSRFTLDFNTLRFNNDDAVFVNLLQGEQVLCRVDVADYIARHHDRIDITGKQEALLPLYFRHNAMSLQVSVAPWEVVEIQPAAL